MSFERFSSRVKLFTIIVINSKTLQDFAWSASVRTSRATKRENYLTHITVDE